MLGFISSIMLNYRTKGKLFDEILLTEKIKLQCILMNLSSFVEFSPQVNFI